MAKRVRKAAKRPTATRRKAAIPTPKSSKLEASKSKTSKLKSSKLRSAAAKAGKPKSGKSRPANSRSGMVQLQNELRTTRDHQSATAEILRAIAMTSGDAERALQQIAKTTARLFGVPSVRIGLVENGEWSRTISVGVTSERIATAVPAARRRLGERTLPSAVVLENRQIHIPDVDNPDPSMADWPGLRPAREAGTRVMAGTPLRREDKAIGALIVYRDRLAPFTAEELTLLQTFADQAVIAIENVRLFNETQEALERQTATADILKVIASSPTDVQPVFKAIAASANRLIGGFSATVMLFVGNALQLVAFTPTTPAADEVLQASFPRPIAEFPPFELVRDGKTVQFPDTESKNVPPVNRELARLRGYRGMVFTPLMSKGMPIGILSVTRKEPGTFAAHHVQLLQTFADQAVIAIENVRLFNETQEALERQTAVSDILRVISSSPDDVQPVFNTVAERAARICGAQFVDIIVVQDDAMHQAASFGNLMGLDTGERVPVDRTTIMGRSIFDRKPFHINDALAVGDDFPGARQLAIRFGHRTVLAVPLLREGRALGTILVRRTEVRPFEDKHIALLNTFADQAAIAIENVRLLNETREALERQTATADILKVIASSPSDVQPVFDAIAASANRLIGGFSTAVFRFVDDVCHLAAFTPVNAEADEFLKASFPRPIADVSPFSLVRAGETVQYVDTESEDVPTLTRNLARSRGYRSMLFTPLMSGNTGLGLISVTRKEPGSFPARHMQLVQTFADQAVIAIENVRLFDEVQAKTADLQESLQQQTVTSDVLKVISRSAFDLQTVLDTLVESAGKLCNATTTNIWLRDGDVLRAQAQIGMSEEFSEFLRTHPIARDRGRFVGRAFLTGKLVHLPDVLADPEYTFVEAPRIGQFRSALGVPLIRDGQVEGVFALVRPEPGGFTDREIELVRTFADQALIAIENVRLFDEVQARTKELAASLDDLRTAQDRLVQTEKLASLGQLTAGIAHEIKNPLNFVNNFSALSAELTDELNDVLKPAPLTDKMRGEVDELTGLIKDNLEKVVQHGKRADSIVKNMLLHSREGSGEQRSTDINGLLDESLNLAYHGARAEKPGFNITLQRDFDESAGSIDAFPQEITRAFLNLISNGFYAATKRQAESNGDNFEPLLCATTRDLGSRVEVRIRDNGTGIPPEVKEKMFNPFFTTKPAGEGTGLGLSMSHDIIVKQHGGRIDVETEPGCFTEFTIVLPRTIRR